MKSKRYSSDNKTIAVILLIKMALLKCRCGLNHNKIFLNTTAAKAPANDDATAISNENTATE